MIEKNDLLLKVCNIAIKAGEEILKFSNKIINQILSMTGIKLEIEPTLI